MTSGTDACDAIGPAPILWITGLSGTGKSTLARSIVARLQTQGLRPLLLDGDHLREALDEAALVANHHPAQRLQRAWRIARLARLAALQGVPVVVATISLVHAVQEWSRAGPAPYAEVLLATDLDVLRARKPDLYQSGDPAHPPHVVGLDIPAEYPRAPEVHIHQQFEPGSLARHSKQVMHLWNERLSPQALQA